MTPNRKRLLFLAALALAGCGQLTTAPNPDPPPGTSSFVSAAGQSGQQSAAERGGADAAAPASASDSSQRTVEQGDIYRVLSPNRLLNLNSYRGLQVIDLTDVHAPKILGRVALTGTPVEMYVVGTRAYVLLNNWSGYYGSRSDVLADQYQGGLVVAVDLSDPAAPVVTSRAQVPGWITASRLTRGGGKEALFVAASNWGGQSTTVVRSFAVSAAGQLDVRTTLDLGGYVIDIQATPAALLVARHSWDGGSNHTAISIIDIADPDGNMVEGAAVAVAGSIQNKTNMDLSGSILRVASGTQWGGAGSNYIETFSVHDIHNPLLLDRKSFGDGQSLFATLFLGQKAFCVTYKRVDPFHAFEITDTGVITAKSEYVISGWNDYFVPVLGDTRLVGIGMDDTSGRSMAASLYDITDLANPAPFITRATIDFDYSWSEARYDDRAFSVLEGAVTVAAPDGTPETGLILLPFTGYSSNWSNYVAGVQIFTFSGQTLTKRGLMNHGSQVRRSFQTDQDITANLSEEQLSLYNSANPGAPVELGRLDVAPNYSDFLIYGDHGVRLRSSSYGWWGSATPQPDDEIQAIPLTGDPDLVAPVATVKVPAGTRLAQVGNLAVAVATTWATTYSTTVRVIDLTDPTNPTLRGALTTDAIQPDYGYWRGGPMGGEDCFDCGGGYGYGSPPLTAGSSLVFPTRTSQNEVLGTSHVCYTYPRDSGSSCWQTEGCSYLTGGLSCASLNGAPQTCTGALARCTYSGSSWTCAKVDTSSVETTSNCYDQETRRYWSNLTLNILDLRDPDHPGLATPVTMPAREDDTSVITAGSAAYVTYREPVQVQGDARSYMRYYFKRIDLANPTSPSVGGSVNIPGELLVVDGDSIYTRDFVWGANIVETALNKLHLAGGFAFLDARRRFVDRDVHTVLLDGSGHALVSHGASWYRDGGYNSDVLNRERLSILDTAGATFPVAAEIDVDAWAQLRDAQQGRALFAVPGGILVLNLQNAAAPYAQAYFPLTGWPARFVPAGNDLYIPAGVYGLYRFQLDSYNLLTD